MTNGRRLPRHKCLPVDGGGGAPALPFVEDVENEIGSQATILGLFRAVESEILDFGSTAWLDQGGQGNNLVGPAGGVVYDGNGFGGDLPGAHVTGPIASGNIDLGYGSYVISGYFRDIGLIDAIFAYIGAVGSQVFGRVNGAAAGVVGSQVANPNINRAQSTNAYSMASPAVVSVVGDLTELFPTAEPDIRYDGSSVYNSGAAAGGNSPPLADGPILIGGAPASLPMELMAGSFVFYGFPGARDLSVVAGVESAIARAVARGNWE